MASKPHHLQQRLGLFQVTLAGIGVIVGAGIFVIIGLVAGHAGSSLWMSFLLAALAAICTGLSYAELSSIMPKDAGEFLFAKRALGKFAGFVALVMVTLMSIFAAASVSMGFAGYFASLTGISHLVLIAVAVILLFSFFNWHGIRDIAIINTLFTFASIAALLFIIVLAFMNGAPTDFTSMPHGWGGIFKGASLVFFAYLGFEGIIRLTEETKHPQKNIPKAIMWSIIISTILYIGVALAAVSLLDWSALANSTAPLADVVASVFGSKAFIAVAIVALCATANTVLLTLVFASRGLYGLGEAFPRLRLLTRVSKEDTPQLAIVIASSLALLFLLFKRLEMMAELTNLFIFIAFIIVNVSLIILRYKEPFTVRSFRSPISIGKLPVLPVIGLLTIFFLVANMQLQVIVLGGVFIALLVPLYFFLSKKKLLASYVPRKPK